MRKTNTIVVDDEELIQNDLGFMDVTIEKVIILVEGKEPRHILIKLHDTQTRRTVLSKAKNLKRDDTGASRNVCIVPDKGGGQLSGFAKGIKRGK